MTRYSIPRQEQLCALCSGRLWQPGRRVGELQGGRFKGLVAHADCATQRGLEVAR